VARGGDDATDLPRRDLGAAGLGGRSVELRHPGRAHTDGDLAVLVPDARVAFLGDLVTSDGPPGLRDSYPLEWPDALAALLGDLTGTVVPGHGPVVDRAGVEVLLANLQEVSRRVEDIRSGRSSVAEAIADPPVHPRALAQALGRCGIEGET
jgi:glyoxylase-like metal-dependent hydrolase (beta-lactamase superfamily II)